MIWLKISHLRKDTEHDTHTCLIIRRTSSADRPDCLIGSLRSLRGILMGRTFWHRPRTVKNTGEYCFFSGQPLTRYRRKDADTIHNRNLRRVCRWRGGGSKRLFLTQLRLFVADILCYRSAEFSDFKPITLQRERSFGYPIGHKLVLNWEVGNFVLKSAHVNYIWPCSFFFGFAVFFKSQYLGSHAYFDLSF